ncbi:MAG: hypothetical protein WC229_03250 [Candidatus Paceibacterota bacterium]|jgi:hypothetical protein
MTRPYSSEDDNLKSPNNIVKEDEEGIDFVRKYLGDQSDKFSNVMTEKLNSSELGSVLMGICNKRIGKLTPRDLMENYNGNRFTVPSKIDVVELKRVELFLMSNLPEGFDLVEISPIVPVGSSSVLTNINSKTALQTIRSTEVVSDSTISMSLESARRKMEDSRWETSERKDIGDIKLANSCRVLRLQKFYQKHLCQHFSAFNLTSSGRNIGQQGFEEQAMHTHLDYWLGILGKMDNLGFEIKNIKVYLSDIKIVESLVNSGVFDRNIITDNIRGKSLEMFETVNVGLPGKVKSIKDVKYDGSNRDIITSINTLKRLDANYISVLRGKFPNIDFMYDLSRPAGVGYYNGVCFKIKGTNPEGQEMSLADGGSSDWVSKLTSDTKERFFGSCFGLELVLNNFKK